MWQWHFHMRHFATGTRKSMSCVLRCLVPLLAQSPISRGFSCLVALVALVALATEGSSCSCFYFWLFLHSIRFCLFSSLDCPKCSMLRVSDYSYYRNKTNRYSRKKHEAWCCSICSFRSEVSSCQHLLPVLVCYLESFQDLRGWLRLKETNWGLSSQFLWTIYYDMAI